MLMILKFTEKDQYTMIYDRNDLSKLYYQSKRAGYNQHLQFCVGIISELGIQVPTEEARKGC